MKSSSVFQCFALALAALSFSTSARGGIIEFGPSSLDPNASASANMGAYGSDANVSVGYSAYTYNYYCCYGSLDGGSGAGIYSDNYLYTEAMTFTAAGGYTVTLDSFDLAQYFYDPGNSVDISVTGGTQTYSLTDTPGGIFTTYSPDVTGNSLTLTITNLYDVGLNTITYSEAPVGSGAPEPSTVLMAAIACGMLLLRAAGPKLGQLTEGLGTNKIFGRSVGGNYIRR